MQLKLCVGIKRRLQVEGLCVRVRQWGLKQLSARDMVLAVLPE